MAKRAELQRRKAELDDETNVNLTPAQVKEKLLTSKGYGQENPLVENDSEANKAKNRRVQFKILEKADLAPTAIQKEGTVPEAKPVAPVAPKPVAPKPVAPKPVAPKPAAPKPHK